MCRQDGLIDVKCVKRANLMTCARPDPSARVFVSHTGPDANASSFVSPPWRRQWYCRPQLPQRLLLHKQHPHQRGPLRRQPRPMETVARPVAFSWHPLHPGVYQRGVFGDKFIAHTEQDRRRERGSVAGAGSAGTGRVDGRSRLTSLELVIDQRKNWLNWFGFANQLGNPTDRSCQTVSESGDQLVERPAPGTKSRGFDRPQHHGQHACWWDRQQSWNRNCEGATLPGSASWKKVTQ